MKTKEPTEQEILYEIYVQKEIDEFAERIQKRERRFYNEFHNIKEPQPFKLINPIVE